MKRQGPRLPACVSISLSAHMDAKSGIGPKASLAVCGRSCRACHEATGQDYAAMLKGFNGAPRERSSKKVRSGAGERSARYIAGGAGQKKPVTPLPEKELNDAVAFVRTVAGK